MRARSMLMGIGSLALVAAAVPQVTGGWPTPAKTVNKEGKFWDASYNNGVSKSYWAQHLGVDLKASTKDNVVSPVNGFVIFNNSRNKGVTQGKAYVVIKDTSTGWEHVLGHISSTRPTCSISLYPSRCPESARVYAGQSIIGYPMPKDEFGVHVHWGVNKKGITSAIGSFTGQKWKLASGKAWGWGRAPYEAELAMACSLGWINPVNYNKCE